MTLEEGIRMLDTGDLDGAITVFNRVLRTSQDSYLAHLHLAVAYSRKAAAGDSSMLRAAERSLGEAIRRAGPDLGTHETLIAIGNRMGLGGLMLSAYRSRFSGLPFAHEIIHAIEQANPKPFGTLATSVPEFLLANIKPVAAVIAVLGAIWWFTNRPSAPPAAPPRDDFTLSDLRGNRVSLSQFQGNHVVILDFWATWCGPCRSSMPALHDLKSEYGSRGLEILSINLREQPDAVAEFLSAQGLKLNVLLDTDGAIARKFQVSGIPTILVVDKSGVIRHKVVGWGPGIKDQLRNVLEPLL